MTGDGGTAEIEAGMVPLEACVCGEHFYCPDGWHSNEELPCGCTPDCAYEEEG